MRDLAIAAAAAHALPKLYWIYGLFRRWTAVGVFAFAALVIVVYLMVAKPM